MLLVVDRQRGDTLIEVIMACAMFAMITASIFAIMQRSSAGAYDALERSEVRLQLNQQAELLNYFRDQFVVAAANGQSTTDGAAGVWNKFAGTTYATTTAPGLNSCTPNARAFYFDADGTSYNFGANAVTAASGMPSAGSGLWIQMVNPSSLPAPVRKFHDFYILACWPSTASSTQYMSSIVRLYEPN
jgi:Tfp pilus assembly protein PilV